MTWADSIVVISTNGQSKPVPLYIGGPASSSMDVAWNLVDSGSLPVWGGVLVQSQTGGRGRMGRVWQSPPGHIYGALRLPTDSPFDGPGAALLVAFLLREAIAEAGLELKIKWPNDLISTQGKVGGLLLESKKGFLIAGIGLNLKNPPTGFQRDPKTPPAAALPLPQAPEILWPLLMKNVISRTTGLSGQDTTTWFKNAEKYLLWLGEEVVIEEPSSVPPSPPRRPLKGLLTGLGPTGSLRLTTATGQLDIWSGSVFHHSALTVKPADITADEYI